MAGGLIDRMFGSGARHSSLPGTAPVVPAQQQQPGQIPQGTGTPAAGTTATGANGTNPTNGTGATAAGADATKSPFAEFESLWQPALGPDGKPLQVTTDPLYTVDGTKVLEAARRTDFKSSITQEQMQAIAKGGPEAVQAMLSAMENMSQLAYANAAVAATRIAEQGITKALSQAEGRLPGLIRNQQLSESLTAKNPALSNPAVAPLVEMVKSQFIQKNPTATTAEIQASVDSYFLKVGSAFNPTLVNKEAAELATQAAKDNEWDKFFGSEQDTGGPNFNF